MLHYAASSISKFTLRHCMYVRIYKHLFIKLYSAEKILYTTHTYIRKHTIYNKYYERFIVGLVYRNHRINHKCLNFEELSALLIIKSVVWDQPFNSVHPLLWRMVKKKGDIACYRFRDKFTITTSWFLNRGSIVFKTSAIYCNNTRWLKTPLWPTGQS